LSFVVIAPERQAKGPLYTVVISEKGGAERREVFDRTELSVGRVQGNDLMLQKGNVSKRHARLLYRDSRFIVTDLNSTNGTYVNRRRISQATIVREGDRIYIGDFVLRVELGEGQGDLAGGEQSGGSGPILSQQISSAQNEGSRSDISIPHAEHVEDSRPSYPEVPGPPRMPTGARAPEAISIEVEHGSPSAAPSGESRPSSGGDVASSVADDRLSHESAVYRVALSALVERVRGTFDPGVLEAALDDALIQRIERQLSEQIASMRGHGELGLGVPNEALTRDARVELVELGPVSALLDDPDVSDITVPRFDQVYATRGGRSFAVEPPFSSDGSLRLALARLCRASGAPLGAEERVVERRLVNGVRVSGLLTGVGRSASVVVIRKPAKSSATLEELVRRGTVSRAMATFLTQCVSARCNLLVVGSRDSGMGALVGALGAAAGDRRVLALQDLDDMAPSTATRLPIGEHPERTAEVLRVAARVPEARLIVDLVSPEAAVALIAAIGEGSDGVIAAYRAATLRRGLARLPGEWSARWPGVNLEAARDVVASAFDIAIEVARLRDGRQRVLRICELTAGTSEVRTHDIFAFVVERTAAGGAIEGTFAASGVVPRVVEELTARGVTVETSLFTRPPSR
jgi:pilus assembly protein CpaF